MIDIVRELRVEIPQWIIRERSQMHDRVKAFQVCPGKIPQILAHLGNSRQRATEVATSEEIGVETTHLIASGTKNRPCHGADITFMTSQQNFHMPPIWEKIDEKTLV